MARPYIIPYRTLRTRADTVSIDSAGRKEPTTCEITNAKGVIGRRDAPVLYEG